MNKVTTAMVEIARELELEVEPEDVAKLLQSQNKTWTNEELLLVDDKENSFLRSLFPSSPRGDAVKIIEMTTKDLEYDINLVDKGAARFEMVDSNLKEVLLWVMLSNCMLKRNNLWKEESIGMANFSLLS